MESIELVELNLEPVLESSGIVHRRIGPGFTVIFGWFWVILGVKMGIKVDFFPIGIDRARRVLSGIPLESSGIVHRRIGPGFTGFFGCFGWFWVILGVKMGIKVDFFRLESIELVEFYLESRWNHLE